jgi:hypothetical protein
VIADRSPARRHQHLRLDIGQLPRNLLHAVAGDAEQQRLRSGLARELRQRVRVGLHQLPRWRLLPDGDQLVSSGEDCDAWPAMHVHACRLASSRQGQLRGAESGSARQHDRAGAHLLAAMADVLPCLRRVVRRDAHLAAVPRNVLLHDDTVRAARHRCAREDARGFTSLEWTRGRRVSGGNFVDHAQRAGRIAGADRVAVHHRDVGSRQIARGGDLARENAPAGLAERHLFTWQRAATRLDLRDRFRQRDHLRCLRPTSPVLYRMRQ